MLNKMKSLIAQLKEADAAYYGKDNPIMTDLEYDRLYNELAQLERDTGIILASSPTQRVSGEVLEGLSAVSHTKPMLSADKTKSTGEIFKFVSGRRVVISWKLDGLTLVLRYAGGKLVQAITRGDGLKGEDVTHTVRVMENVPLTTPCTEPLEVRGEGVVSWQNFKELNESLEEPYSHPRNLAAGSIRKLDARESKKRRLERQRALEEEMMAAEAAAEAAAIIAAAPPTGGADIMEVNTEKSMELRKNVRQFAQNNPEIAAQMVKAWLRGEDDNNG